MMRKIMLGAMPALLMVGGGAQAATPAWTISEVSGPVTLMENGRTRAASRGALLSSGSVIATARGARAVIVRGGEFVVIAPGSRLRVPEARSANRVVQIIQDLGSAVFNIEKKSSPHFGVQTPYLAAVVKGTTFTVTVGEEGGKVEVSEGAVEVATLDGGAMDLVRPGMMAMVGKNDRFSLVVQGDETKILRSTNAPTASVTVPAPVQPVAVQPAAAPAGDASVVRIAAVVVEEPVSLDDATDGLIDGDSAAEFAQADFRDLARAVAEAPVAQPPAAEPDSAPPGDVAAPPVPAPPAPAGPVPPPPPPPPADPAPPPPAPVDPAPPPAPPEDEDSDKDDGKDKDDKGPKDKPGKDDDKPGKDEDKPGKDEDQTPGKADDKPGKGDDMPGKGDDDDDRDDEDDGRGGRDDDDDDDDDRDGDDDDDDDEDDRDDDDGGDDDDDDDDDDD